LSCKEEEIFERVLAENAANIDNFAVPLEVDAVILHAIAVNLLPATRELAKFLIVLLEVLRKKLEAVDHLELQLARERSQFLGAHGVKDDLQHQQRIAEA